MPGAVCPAPHPSPPQQRTIWGHYKVYSVIVRADSNIHDVGLISWMLVHAVYLIMLLAFCSGSVPSFLDNILLIANPLNLCRNSVSIGIYFCWILFFFFLYFSFLVGFRSIASFQVDHFVAILVHFGPDQRADSKSLLIALAGFYFD